VPYAPAPISSPSSSRRPSSVTRTRSLRQPSRSRYSFFPLFLGIAHLSERGDGGGLLCLDSGLELLIRNFCDRLSGLVLPIAKTSIAGCLLPAQCKVGLGLKFVGMPIATTAIRPLLQQLGHSANGACLDAIRHDPQGIVVRHLGVG
jgi:hypothetical protein